MTEGIAFRTINKPVWCPGCGAYGLLNALTRKVLPNLGVKPHETFVVSGIGCSSRIPGYINTYGLNSVHGRAIPIAQGAKLTKPDLNVIAIGGDGDFFSIGAGHLPHAVRRNVDITCIMVNNFVYALTKGQTSPTTPRKRRGEGEFLSLAHYPPVDPVLDVISYSVSSQASFVAQGIASDVQHLADLIEEGIRHAGFSFISVLTQCATFNPPGMFDTMKENITYLNEGEMIQMPDFLGGDSWIHDPADIGHALQLARAPVMEKPHAGVFFKGTGLV